MKILVVGSLRDPEGADEKPDSVFVKKNAKCFQAACEALGGALARRKHTIMVGVPTWSMLRERETVATYIVEGASNWGHKGKKTATNAKVTFYGPREQEPRNQTAVLDSLQELKALPHVDITEDKFETTGGWKARAIPYIADVDAVMLISGRDGTASIGYAAYAMGKPIIALTAFEGAACSIAQDVLAPKYGQLVEQGYLTTNPVRDLQAYWDKDVQKNLELADKVIETTEKLVKAYDRARQSSARIMKQTTVGSVVLLALWLFLYMSSVRCTGASFCGSYVNVAFFVLLYVSALLGAGLRTLAAYRKDMYERISALDLSLDAAISLLVAFGMALVYLIGGISFTGTVVVLQPNAENQAFATVAISMSLIGLAAGYLLPLSVLGDQLRKAVAVKKQ